MEPYKATIPYCVHKKIIFIRHGMGCHNHSNNPYKLRWNPRSWFHRENDAPLSAIGMKQADQTRTILENDLEYNGLGHIMKSFNPRGESRDVKVYVSPLQRTSQTCRQILGESVLHSAVVADYANEQSGWGNWIQTRENTPNQSTITAAQATSDPRIWQQSYAPDDFDTTSCVWLFGHCFNYLALFRTIVWGRYDKKGPVRSQQLLTLSIHHCVMWNIRYRSRNKPSAAMQPKLVGK